MKRFITLTAAFVLFCLNLNSQNIQTWGTMNDANSDVIKLYLGTSSNTVFQNLPLIEQNHLNEISFLYGTRNNSMLSSSSTLDFISLFQTYTKINGFDYQDHSNRSILPLEAPTTGTLADYDEGNFFRFRLPYDGGLDEINNDIIISPIIGRGLQHPTKRRMLWRDLFLSVIIQNEILSDEMRGVSNVPYKTAQRAQLDEFHDSFTAANSAVQGVIDAMKFGVGLHEIASSEVAPNDLVDYLGNMAVISADAKIQDRLGQLGSALQFIDPGVSILSSTFETLVLKSLQTAESDKRLEMLEDWITSSEPGYFDSEIRNGFDDAKLLYQKIANETFNAIAEVTLTNMELWGELFHIAIGPVMDIVKTKVAASISLKFAHGAFFAVSQLIDLGVDLNDKYDLLRLATLSATLEEYLGAYLNNYLINIGNERSAIEFKQNLIQMNYFLGYYYFKMIKQVYDNAWYTKTNLLITLSGFFNAGDVTDDDVIAYCNEGINRNMPKYDLYCQPYLAAKSDIYWFSSLISNFISSEPFLSNGNATPSQVISGSSIEFSVLYKSIVDEPPSEVRVFIDGTGYPMQKDEDDDNFLDGVKYTYGEVFNTAKLYYYSFSANKFDGTPIKSFPETGWKNFLVSENPAGWDIRVTEVTSSPTYMLDGQNVTFRAGVHNSSNTPDKIYNNIFYKFELYSPSGILIDEESGTISSVNQGQTVTVSEDLYTQDTYGNYTCVFAIYPAKDAETNNNSLSNTVVVGQEGPSRQYYVTQSEAWVELDNSTPSHSYAGHTYTLTYVGTSDIRISQDGDSPDRIYNHDFREYNSKNYVLICEGVNTIGDDAASISFGTQNTNYVTFDETNITCHPGDEIDFIARCTGSTFSTSSANIYRNEAVDDWHYDVDTYDDRHRAHYEFRIPSSTSPGTYSFWIGTELGSESKFLRELTITVIPPPPYISSISKNIVSADDVITISGSDLGFSGTVRFGDILASYESWTNSSISCTVPEGITDGVLTVSNSGGSSNGQSYTVYSSTGSPTVDYGIPDQTMNPGETRLIADLNDVFEDPNGNTLLFSVVSDNVDMTYNESELTSGLLFLNASTQLLANSIITVSGVDNTGKSATDDFIISVPNILRISSQSIFVNEFSGIATVDIVSNVDWQVETSSNWINATKTDPSTLAIAYDQNASFSDKTGSVVLSGPNVEMVVISVIQNGISLDPSESPILGNTEVYGDISMNTNRRALPFTMPEAGDIESVSIYHQGSGDGSDLLLGVYSDVGGSPGSLVGVTPVTGINVSEGWQTVNLNSSVGVGSGETVWLAWMFENNPGIRYQAGSPGRADAGAGWTGVMPSSFGVSTTAGYTYSIYCTYTESSGTSSDKTLGNRDVYGDISMNTNRRALPFTMQEAGDIESVSIYHQGSGDGSDLLLGVYSDVGGSPGSLVGVTPVTGINVSEGWQTVNLNSSVGVGSGETVWLAWMFENSPGIRYQAGSPGRADSGAGWTGVMPSSFGVSTTAGYTYSIYCTYTPSSTLKSTQTVTEVIAEPEIDERVFIYPNPTSGELTATWNKEYDEGLLITIYSSDGKIVKNVEVPAAMKEVHLDLNDYQPGMYLILTRERVMNRIIDNSRIIKN